jgi:hypothetical protein
VPLTYHRIQFSALSEAVSVESLGTANVTVQKEYKEVCHLLDERRTGLTTRNLSHMKYELMALMELEQKH